MSDILETIIAHKRIETTAKKKAVPLARLCSSIQSSEAQGSARRSLVASLRESPAGIIAEFKRKSPSKGWIAPDAAPENVVPGYVRNGAAALSILTDSEFFGGSPDFLRTARSIVPAPILRKDFIIDEYQLFEAREMGADAVLLIAACLTLDECRSLAATARSLNLETLLEIHSKRELDYIACEPDMIGINNRNLGTFHTDVETSFRLAEQLPADVVKVSESGISRPETIRSLREAGFRGFLIGEFFMRHTDPGEALREFISAI